MEHSEFTIYLCGKHWILERPADLESLWDAIGADATQSKESTQSFMHDERLPYWVELWPSSIGLAKWLEKAHTHILGKNCLDVGCGLGLTAMIAASFGARVIAMDYEADAVHYAQRSAARNAVPQPLWTVMDWRKPALKKQCMDYVWAGDIMYERCFAEPLLRFFDHCLAADGVVWIAEPGRSVYHHLHSLLHSYGFKAEPVHAEKVGAAYAQAVPVTVTVWELTRSTVKQGKTHINKGNK